MSEQEKLAAIAKIKAQGCRRWMTLLLIAPVFLCAVLAILAPTIRQYLARGEAKQQCQTLSQQVEAVSNSTIFQTDAILGEASITANHIEQMILFGETVLEARVLSRDYIAAVSHPNGAYMIYAIYQPSYATRFYVCDDGEALGAFTADETARDVVFNQDGSLFALANGRYGAVMLFDGVDIRRIETINVRGEQQYRQIDSIAFHPTEPLLFFTSENELFVYETEHFTQRLNPPISETAHHEIGFNADGTLFFMSPIGEEPLAYVWGVRD